MWLDWVGNNKWKVSKTFTIKWNLLDKAILNWLAAVIPKVFPDKIILFKFGKLFIWLIKIKTESIESNFKLLPWIENKTWMKKN